MLIQNGLTLEMIIQKVGFIHFFDMPFDLTGGMRGDKCLKSSLFDIILYVNQSTVFQLCRDGSSWVEPALSKDT